MKKIMPLIFAVVFFAALTAYASEKEFTRNSFQYSVALKGDAEPKKIYRVHLDKEIISKCRDDYGDIRIFDSKGRETGYVIIDDYAEGRLLIEYKLMIIGFENAEPTIVNMVMPEKNCTIASMDIDIADRDFSRNVVLEGSTDGNVWEKISEDAIYDFSSQVDLRKTELLFKPSDYNFYRLKLFGSGDSNKDKKLHLKYDGLDLSFEGRGSNNIRINSVTARSYSANAGGAIVYDSAAFDNLTVEKGEKNSSVIKLNASLPFEKVTFDIENLYFYRNVGIYASNTSADSGFTKIGAEAIYNFNISGFNQKKDYISITSGKHKFYKFVIENNNNSPLDVKSLRLDWVRKNLFFVADGAKGKYTLCFGNPKAYRPDYDLSRFIGQRNWQKAEYSEMTVGEITENEITGQNVAEIASGANIILVAVIIILVIAFAFWGYKLIKHGAGDEEN